MRKIFSLFVVALLCTLLSCAKDSNVLETVNPQLELRSDGGYLYVSAVIGENQTVNYSTSNFELQYVSAGVIRVVVAPGTAEEVTVNASQLTITGSNAQMSLSCLYDGNTIVYDEVQTLSVTTGNSALQLNLDGGSIITQALEVTGDEMGGI